MTTSEVPTTPTDKQALLDSLDPEMREHLERLEKTFAGIHNQSVGESLTSLYEQGDQSGFETALEDVVYELMDEDPYYQSLREDLRKVRALSGNRDDSEIVEKIKKLDENYRKMVLSMAGLPESGDMQEIESARQNVAAILEPLGSDRSNPDKVMEALGIRKTDDQSGETIMHFPTELMPESVNKEWGTYLASVGDFDRATQRLRESSDMNDRDAVVEIDARRRRIHNKLAKDFQHILGLTDKDGWDFESTRNVLAAIRDQEFKVYGSIARTPEEERQLQIETEKVQGLVAENADGLAVIAKLSSKK